MIRIIVVALACAVVSAADAEPRWWAITPGGTCVDAVEGHGGSPAQAFRIFRYDGGKPIIDDKGDGEVVVRSSPNDPLGGVSFFHSLDACQRVARANADAVKAEDRELDRKLDKYR